VVARKDGHERVSEGKMDRGGALELGDLLISEGLISKSQLKEALAEQARTRERLGEILLRRGSITHSDLLNALARQLGLRRFDPARDEVQTSALNFVPVEFARRHNILPVRLDGQSLTVATADPLDVEAMDPLRRLAGQAELQVEVLLAPLETLEEAREQNYAKIEDSRNVNELIDKVADEFAGLQVSEEDLDEGDAAKKAQDAGTIRLVEQIIDQALAERATDIHIEPQERGLMIRYRVDGLLYNALTPPRSVYLGTVSRIKILANMDIAERRAAQDGRFTHRKNGREVDIRVSVIPTIHGEKLVLRLLQKTGFNFALRDLGYSEDDYRRLLRAIHQPYGMILLSGPTGSGKSTTLYAGLLELKNETINITTVEDPVEYHIGGINQVQVNERKDLTFGTALRSFLRQDPDVIMVGEVRDQDTADIAVRAALTGHMVFSTIHANDAPTTATRLISMGVEPFMAASAFSLVAAQRLVRRTCKYCLEEYWPAEDVLVAMKVPLEAARAGGPSPYRRGTGCAQCRRGYRGRVAIVEMMSISPDLRQIIAENRPASEIRALAVREGMKTLRQSGLDKALAGETTLEEVLRVCLSDEG
jgi:type IV pilus assembly protein PilB